MSSDTTLLSTLRAVHNDWSPRIVTVLFVVLICGWLLLWSLSATGSSLEIRAEPHPANSLAPINAGRLPFTSFSLSNHTDADVGVSGINVETTSATIADIQLVDDLGFQVGETVQPDSRGRASVGGDFIIPAGSTHTFVIAANIGDCPHPCADNKTEAVISVLGLSTSATLSGNLPISGATHLINSDLKIGSVSASIIDGGQPIVMFTNNKDVVFSNLRFTADGNEEVKLYSLRYRYAGSANYRAISNLNVKIDDSTHPAVWSPDGAYVTASFPEGLLVKGGHSIEVSLRGDVAIDHSLGQTVQFNIENPSEAYFVGQIYGYGIQPKATFPRSGRSWFTGHSFNNGGNKPSAPIPSLIPAVI